MFKQINHCFSSYDMQFVLRHLSLHLYFHYLIWCCNMGGSYCHPKHHALMNTLITGVGLHITNWNIKPLKPQTKKIKSNYSNQVESSAFIIFILSYTELEWFQMQMTCKEVVGIVIAVTLLTAWESIHCRNWKRYMGGWEAVNG